MKEELRLAAYYQGMRQSITDTEPFHTYKRIVRKATKKSKFSFRRQQEIIEHEL